MNHENRPALHYVCAVLAVAILSSVAVMLAARLWGYSKLVTWMTLAASTGFLILPLLGGALRTGFGRWILAGLALCWIGDFVGPSNFVAGLAAFLAAHVLLILASIAHGLAWPRVLRMLPSLMISSLAIVYWLSPHVPRYMALPVVLYMIAITAMVLLAAGTASDSSGRLFLLAAIVFYISDIFVARWRFVHPGPLNAFCCYPLYYTACILFGFSAWPGQSAAPASVR